MFGGKLTVGGTPGYAAPEQLEGGETTARTDIHAIGRLAYTAFQVRAEAHGVPFTEKEVPRCWRLVLARATSSIADQWYESADALAHVPQLPESREALPLAAQFPQDARSVLSHHRVRWSVDLGGACAQMPGRGRPPAARRSPALSPGARAFIRGHESTVHFFNGRERFACVRGSMWMRTGKVLSGRKNAWMIGLSRRSGGIRLLLHAASARLPNDNLIILALAALIGPRET